MMQMKANSMELQQLHSIAFSSFYRDLFTYSCLMLLQYIIFFYLYSSLSVILLFSYRQYCNSFYSLLTSFLLILLDYFLSKSQTDLNIIEFDFKTDLFKEVSHFLLLSFDYIFYYDSISIQQIGESVFLNKGFSSFFSSFNGSKAQVIGIIILLMSYLLTFSSWISIDQFKFCSNQAQLICNLALILQFLMGLMVREAFSASFMIPLGGLIKKQLVWVTLTCCIESLYLKYKSLR